MLYALQLKILNKISLDTPERLIKAFNYRDWYCSYDVEPFRKGLPGHILEELCQYQISYFQTLTVVEKYLEMQKTISKWTYKNQLCLY